MKNFIQPIVVRLSYLTILALLGWSCQNENVTHQSPEQIQAQTQVAAQDNSQIVAATQDVLDVTAGALAGQGITDGSGSSYGRCRGPELECAPSISATFNVDRSNADSVVYSGTITVDYGAGTACKDSTDLRSGKIMDSFIFVQRFHDSIAFDLTQTVTFQEFRKDSIQVDGTFISHSSSTKISTLDIQNARITYADGTFVSWNGMLTNTFRRATTEMGSSSRELTGSINGTNRAGVAFSANITKAILFQYSCSRNIPVSGSIDLTVGGVLSVVDYGDGTCDKIYTITTGGTTTQYSFKRHHEG